MCLTDAYRDSIIICMRTTINIDDELLAKARDYTGEKEKTKLLHLGLQALDSASMSRTDWLPLGGTMPDLKVPPRRRSA